MTERPLSDLQQRCLVALLQLEEKYPHRRAFTPNEIGFQAGAKTVRQHKWRSQVKGPAQQIIQPLTALQRHRQLIVSAVRDDHQSGSAYRLTDAGRAEARRLKP